MGNDCTNFISQALRAGGFRNRNVGHGTERSLWSWWYNSYRIDEWTHSWSVAQFNYRFHQTTSRGRVVAHYWEVTLGDIMYADWNGDTKQQHAVIFTGRSASSGLKLSMHTTDRRNVDASWWMSKARNDYGPSTDFDYFHMDYGKF